MLPTGVLRTDLFYDKKARDAVVTSYGLMMVYIPEMTACGL
jgi:hypothetical protein